MNERGQVLVSFDRFCTCGFGGEVKVEGREGNLLYCLLFDLCFFIGEGRDEVWCGEVW